MTFLGSKILILSPYFHNITTVPCIHFQIQIPVTNLRRVINSQNSITAGNCGALDGRAQAMHMMEMSGSGFLGAYDPNPNQVST